jgi:hypothetical protein
MTSNCIISQLPGKWTLVTTLVGQSIKTGPAGAGKHFMYLSLSLFGDIFPSFLSAAFIVSPLRLDLAAIFPPD